MSKEITLADIDNRLRQLALLTAAQVLTGALKDAKQREKIGFLDKGGLNREEIADLLGTTPRTVTVELSAMRKALKKK